jgi:hypothetical protein
MKYIQLDGELSLIITFIVTLRHTAFIPFDNLQIFVQVFLLEVVNLFRKWLLKGHKIPIRKLKWDVTGDHGIHLSWTFFLSSLV